MTSNDMYIGLGAQPSKYLDVYISLVTKRIRAPYPDDLYGEKHHIIPRSFGGSNSKENIVRLSAREHFIAHRLLERMFRGDQKNQHRWRKMVYAIWQIMHAANKWHERHETTSRVYEELKRERSKIITETQIGKPFYTDGKIYKKFSPGQEPLGWYKEGPSKGALLGMKRYTNGKDAKLFLEGQQPEGFWLEGNNSGKKWYTDGVSLKRVIEGQQPEGWVRAGAGVGLKWYTDGVNNKKFADGEAPEGWVPGGINKNTKYFTDGKEIKRFIPGSEPEGWRHVKPQYFTDGIQIKRFIPGAQPEGWVGSASRKENAAKGTIWYTNGEDNKRCQEGCQPSGWHRGLTKLKTKI